MLSRLERHHRLRRPAQVELQRLDAMVERVFGGAARPGDVSEMAWTLGCLAVLVLPGDGAWTTDPFGVSSDYGLVEARPNEWRI